MNVMTHPQDGSPGIGRLVFTSSSPDQTSHHLDELKHGVFTYFLIDELKHGDSQRRVNIDTLVQRVKEKVTDYGLKHNLTQTPHAFANIQGTLYLPAYEKERTAGEIIPVPDFDITMEEARAAMENGEYDTASLMLAEVLKADHLNREANRLLTKLDNLRESQQLVEETEKRKNYEEWLRRGEEYIKDGNYAKAGECIKNAGKVFPGSEMVKAYLKDLETRDNITLVGDIEMPAGESFTALKNLFPMAAEAKENKQFTEALNLYNKILKKYPGNKKAIDEKNDLFLIWLEEWKTRPFEILGLMESTIFPDKSLKEYHHVFNSIYEETILAYTEKFLNSSMNRDLEFMGKELENKEKHMARFVKLMKDYQEVAMETEYKEVLELNSKAKLEAEKLKTQKDVRLSLLKQDDIFKDKKNWGPVQDILQSMFNEGNRDKYLIKAYGQINNKIAHNSFNQVKKLPTESQEQIKIKEVAYVKLSQQYPQLLKDTIEGEIKILSYIPRLLHVSKMPESTIDEIAIKLKLLKEIDKSKYVLVKYGFPGQIKKLQSKYGKLKEKKRKSRFNTFHKTSRTIYFLISGFISYLVVKHYFSNGGFFDIVGGILFAIAVLICFYFTVENGYGFRTIEKSQKNKWAIVPFEILKIFSTFTIPVWGYLTMTYYPGAFFTPFTFWYIFAGVINFAALIMLDEIV